MLTGRHDELEVLHNDPQEISIRPTMICLLHSNQRYNPAGDFSTSFCKVVIMGYPIRLSTAFKNND